MHERLKQIEQSSRIEMRNSVKIPRREFDELRDMAALHPDFAKGGRDKRMMSMKVPSGKQSLGKIDDSNDMFGFDEIDVMKAKKSVKVQRANELQAMQDNDIIDLDQIKLE